MEIANYRPRVIDGQVDRYLRNMGAVCLEGTKWCGKTWTGRRHAASEILIGDPAGNFQNRHLVQMDPALGLEGALPRLIDEWQEAPSIWDAVRFRVDTIPTKGQFILTGSSTPLLEGFIHSGAGRIARMRMRTMSLFESGESSGSVSLARLCQNDLTPHMSTPVTLKDLAQWIIRGGWPAGLNAAPEDITILPDEYINAIVRTDLPRMTEHPRNLRKAELLLRSLARNESSTASTKTLIRDIHETDEETLDPATAADYLKLFERLFLTEDVLPFAASLRSTDRIRRAKKHHFADPSIACSLLKVHTPERLIRDLETFGLLFEALCDRDLRIYAEAFGGTLYYYRNYRGDEIDSVIEMPDGSWCAFEIKLGAHQIDKAAENLLRIARQFENDATASAPRILCVICGLTKAAYRRPDGVFVVPITALGP